VFCCADDILPELSLLVGVHFNIYGFFVKESPEDLVSFGDDFGSFEAGDDFGINIRLIRVEVVEEGSQERGGWNEYEMELVVLVIDVGFGPEEVLVDGGLDGLDRIQHVVDGLVVDDPIGIAVGLDESIVGDDVPCVDGMSGFGFGPLVESGNLWHLLVL
jgi:hypothetical protein